MKESVTDAVLQHLLKRVCDSYGNISDQDKALLDQILSLFPGEGSSECDALEYLRDYSATRQGIARRYSKNGDVAFIEPCYQEIPIALARVTKLAARGLQPSFEIDVRMPKMAQDGHIYILHYGGMAQQAFDRLEANYRPDRGEVIERALEIAIRYGDCDGSHRKAWVIDQMVRALAGESYKKLIADACNGEDGPCTYQWDVGTLP